MGEVNEEGVFPVFSNEAHGLVGVAGRECLEREGRRILYRNFRPNRGGEIDLVARDGEVLTFVEVKTRTGTGEGRPLEAVDAKKRRRIERGANEWLRLLGTREIPWRFDVVEVVLVEGEVPQVTVVRNAWGEGVETPSTGARS